MNPPPVEAYSCAVPFRCRVPCPSIDPSRSVVPNQPVFITPQDLIDPTTRASQPESSVGKNPETLTPSFKSLRRALVPTHNIPNKYPPPVFRARIRLQAPRVLWYAPQGVGPSPPLAARVASVVRRSKQGQGPTGAFPGSRVAPREGSRPAYQPAEKPATGVSPAPTPPPEFPIDPHPVTAAWREGCAICISSIVPQLLACMPRPQTSTDYVLTVSDTIRA